MKLKKSLTNWGGATPLSTYKAEFDSIIRLSYNLCMKNYRSKKAFTLAEVLITLGIIGIVAALTIPTLFSVYKKKVVETRLRKTISLITEVVGRIEADEGNIAYLDKGVSYSDRFTAQREFAQTYILKYLTNARLCGTYETEKGRDCVYKAIVNGAETSKFNAYVNGHHINKIVLPDGTGFWIEFPTPTVGNSVTKNYPIHIDLNISKDQMHQGIDYFKFNLIKDNNKNYSYISSINKSSEWATWYDPYLPHCTSKTLSYPDGKQLNWAQLCENPSQDNYYGYSTSFCSVMIECNNWKIPDDYPIKF